MIRETITVAVVSFNEAHELADCLGSCAGADRYLVLDMESTDDTRLVAESLGATVIPVRRVPVVEQVRQVGVDATTTDWLLWIDADERGPGDLRTSLLPHLSRGVAAYRVPFEDIAFGTRLPNFSANVAKVALVRPEAATWPVDSVAHTSPTIEGEIRSLVGVVEPFSHFGLSSIDQGVEKAIRYAKTGGGTFRPRNAADPLLLPRLVWYALIRRKAWRDGTAGMVAASLEIIGNYLAALGAWERSGYRQQHVAPYTRLALQGAAFMDKVARHLWVSSKALFKRTSSGR